MARKHEQGNKGKEIEILDSTLSFCFLHILIYLFCSTTHQKVSKFLKAQCVITILVSGLELSTHISGGHGNAHRFFELLVGAGEFSVVDGTGAVFVKIVEDAAEAGIVGGDGEGVTESFVEGRFFGHQESKVMIDRF